jgi:hypothetical protein
LDPEILPKAGDTTTETKTLTVDNAQRTDALTKHARIVAAKEAEKAKAALLKTPLQPHGPTCTGT